MKKLVFAFIFLAVALSSTFAQKFGHINSQAIIIEMPAVKTADAQLQAFGKGLKDKGMKMLEDFNKDYESAVAKANSKELSPLQLQEVEAELAKRQQEIQAYDREVQQQVLAKREELYAPIFAKVDSAIKEVGKVGEYTMIFDTSAGALLFVNDSQDISALVKTKLGL